MDWELRQKLRNKQNDAEGNAATPKKHINWKDVGIASVIFGLIECLSGIGAFKAEDFTEPAHYYIHCISLCGLLAGGAFLVYKAVKKITWILIPYFFLCAVIFISKSTQSTQPRFNFSMCLASKPEDMFYLTNNFLKVTHFSEATSKPNNLNSILFFQRQSEQPICVLRLFIYNDSPVDADNPEVTVSFDGNWKCSPAPAWTSQMAGQFTVTENPIGVFSTNMFQSWGYALPSNVLLSGRGEELPPIAISQPLNPSGFSIMARAKHSPTMAVGLQIYFPTNFPFIINKPFLILATNDGRGNLTSSISSEKFNELGKQGIISRK